MVEVKDSEGRIVFHQWEKSWWKRDYDKRGNVTKHETSDGYWREAEYDSQNRIISWKTSAGFWEKNITYDERGIKIYSLHSRYGRCGVGLRVYVDSPI